MSQYKDVMIDLETFGNGKVSCITQIGAVYFDRYTGEIGDKFKVNVDAVSAVRAGAQMDPDTVYWWMSQSPEAIASVISEPREDFRKSILLLNEFLNVPDIKIWSHATFDFVIVQESFKLLGIKTLFPYRAARDIRTLMDLAGIDPKSFQRENLHHDALDDCLHQIKYCVAALRKLAEMKP